MIVGCTEISISVTVKHVRLKYLKLSGLFCQPGGTFMKVFSVSEGTEKIARLWLTRGISTQADTMVRKLCLYCA